MKVEVKKVWNGMVSVRDYVIKECLEKGENLVIVHGGQEMTIGREKMIYAKRDLVPQKSKFNEEEYYFLVNFTWKPETPVPGQRSLFEGLKGGENNAAIQG